MTEEYKTDEVRDVLAENVLSSYRLRGMTVAFAESCTGGLTCARLTAIAGSSDVVCGGVVSYSNEVKKGVLGVKEGTLLQYGAVSEQTAGQMAEGVRALTGASATVSITGIAGPGGGTEEKPVGTVAFGVSAKDLTKTVIKHFDSSLSRGEIRMLASDFALKLALWAAEKGVFPDA